MKSRIEVVEYAKPKQQTKTIIWVPDAQIEPGRTPTERALEWVGNYIHDEYGEAHPRVVVGGDWFNMGSLSSYDRRGGRAMEGRRYIKDVDAGNRAFDKFYTPFSQDDCDLDFIEGNHEWRIQRVIEDDASQDGLVGRHHLAPYQLDEWNYHEFLVPVTYDGVTFSHYFVNPGSGRPIGGTVENMLKQIGTTFVQGHLQGFKWGRIDGIRGARIGMVAGSCYVHDEDYLTPQVTNYWRGIAVMHNVRAGEYDLMQVSLDYLARRYEGKPLSAIKWRH